MIRQLGLCAAAGVHPFSLSEEPFEPRKVLFIDAENTERQWARQAGFITSRLEKISGNPVRQMVRVSARGRLDITIKSVMDEIHALCDREEPDILAIGPLYKLVPKEITTDNEAAPLITALDSLRDRGLTLLMEAHAGHDRENMRPRGSSALLGWPEFGLGLKQVEGNPMLMDLVRWRGDRDSREWPKQIARGDREFGQLPWINAEVYV
jgi:hypothetical protein